MDVADLVVCPRAGSQQRIAVSTTAAVTELSAVIKDSGWIEIEAFGTSLEVDYQFGGASVPAVVKDQAGSGTDVGWTIAAGQVHSVYITSADTHISWDASGNGFLVLRKAGRKRTSRNT